MSTELYVCPNCKRQLKEQHYAEVEMLFCETCQLLTPIINGFVLFNEAAGAGSQLTERFKILQQKFTDHSGYESYIQHKENRNMMEVYAAFQPFNESSRAIYPFIDLIRTQLKPNQLIIDTWARTGWSALLLAGLFPKQQIVAIWEKDSSVLGYAGYGYWFNKQRCPPNLSVIFIDPQQDLPFAENSAALIHAHDVLHRRPMQGYLNDLLRVTLDDIGTILLPHIHLANSEPEPYFQRGGELRHGREYDEFLNIKLTNDPRSAMVLSETNLFKHPRPVSLVDASNGQDYNALIVIAQSIFFEAPLTENWIQQPQIDWNILLNPLLTVCPFTFKILLNEQGLGNELAYLLERHPVYEQRLNQILAKKLTEIQYQVLLLCDQFTSISDLAECADLPVSEVNAILLTMRDYELIVFLPVSKLAVELQNFHSNQHKISSASFNLTWQRLLIEEPEFVLMQFEGELLTIGDCAILVDGWRRYLQRIASVQSLKFNTNNELIIPLVMACWIEEISIVSHLQGSELNTIELCNDKKHTIQSINLANDTEEYWTLLEPFLSETLLPLPKSESLIAQVDNEPWYKWYQEFKVC